MLPLLKEEKSGACQGEVVDGMEYEIMNIDSPKGKLEQKPNAGVAKLRIPHLPVNATGPAPASTLT